MNREDAIKKLWALKGKNLHELASDYEVTFRNESGKINKGWAGHVCERHLGLALNSRQEPDFGDWELKVVPIKKLQNGTWRYKETMAITKIDQNHVRENEFINSHLLSKLRRFVLVVRTVGNSAEEPTFIHNITSIELSLATLKFVESDYNEVRQCLLDPKRGFDFLTGRMGKFIQPRTKGPGHGSTSRAFYARSKFLEHVSEIKNLSQ